MVIEDCFTRFKFFVYTNISNFGCTERKGER